MLVELHVEREGIRDGGSQADKLMDNISFMIRVADAGWRICVLSHDLCFLQTDGESKISSSLAETSNELPEVLGLMSIDCRVVCEEEVMQTFQLEIGLGS